ncbi:unnamed protein product [Onchocerca ochengi]|uniref:CCDC92 domain-containing protein n=1 Tax=Onchocerca ochengi TaxID=42157 RepID=A0A182DX40_ONCOC|nr:unnamed protein product [Onchocerca ochengi]
MSTLFAQPPKVPKLDLLPEEKTSSTITDFSKGINEIQRFNQGAEASAQTVVKFNSKIELGEIGSLINEICAERITVAIQERDDMWRRHESAQISFLQNENSQMLTGLHAEIERLHHHLRDLYRRLYVKNSFDSNTMLENENEQLREKLEIAQQNTDKLNQKLEECEKKSRDLEQQTNETIKMLKNQLSYQLPSGTIADTTGTARIHSHSQPNVHWNPAPAPFFGKKDNNLPYTDLIRNASITYPGGRPNVVAQRPRSHHLPSLYSKPRTVPSSGNSIEKPIRLQMLSLQDRILIAHLRIDGRAAPEIEPATQFNEHGKTHLAWTL